MLHYRTIAGPFLSVTTVQIHEFVKKMVYSPPTDFSDPEFFVSRRLISALVAIPFLCSVGTAMAGSSTPIISGVIDGPLTGGNPKAIEIHFPEAVADISICGLNSANNGEGSGGTTPEFALGAVSVSAGEYIYVAFNSAGFMNYFGFAPDFENGVASINGDDAIELVCSGAIVDVFGDVDMDGSGQAWDYLDGWAYRNSMTGPDGTTFQLASWSFSGANALDTCSAETNDTCGSQFPIGTFMAGAPVDNPPEVASTVPDDLDTDVSTSTLITINFNESVSTSAGAFDVDCGSTVAFTASPMDLTNVTAVTLDPDTSLPNSATCTVTVTASGVTDLDGTPDNLAVDYVFEFDTAAPDVTPPTVLSVTPSTTGPTAATSINFTVGFSEAVTGFDDTDVTVNHTGTASIGVMVSANTTSNYTVQVSGISGTGSFTLTVDATGVQDLSMNVGAGDFTSDPVMIDPNAAADYYENVDDSTAMTLRTTLHDTIDDHQWFPYSSGTETATWDILEAADEHPGNSSQILTVYQNSLYTKVTDRNMGSGTDNYNREHTWPRGTGLGNTNDFENSPATDTHNLRLSNTGYNSDRQSKWFDECTSGCTERTTELNNGVGGTSPDDSNFFSGGDGSSGTWEVWTDRRGDIARTMFYMDVRYEGDMNLVTNQMEPQLTLTSDRGQSNSGNTFYMGVLSTLIAWHNEDPVDQKELDRNEVVFGFQGNRNPFVDHPEWVAILYGNVSSCALNVDSPTSGSTFMPGSTISFALNTSDMCYEPTSLVWSSSLDGQIGTGESFMAMLSNGTHTITVSGEDTDTNPISTQFSVTVADTTMVEIFDIQGSGYNSPFDGVEVTTLNNVVTALVFDYDNTGPTNIAEGFVIQTPDARADADPNTSNAIVVFTGSVPTVAIGDLVDVTGTVDEFFGLTELTGSISVSVNSSGNPLPTPITFDATTPSGDPTAPSCTISGGAPADGENENFECFEGMRVTVPQGFIITGNQGFGVDPIAEVYANAGTTRTKREPGIEFPGMAGLPVWDGNPEIFELDLDRAGGASLVIAGGSTYSATGVIGFDFGEYEIWPTSFSLINENMLPAAVRPRANGEFTVGSLNMFRFFDAMEDGDPETDDAVVSQMEYDERLERFSLYIRNTLDSPDILAVQEVDGLPAIQDLASQIQSDDAGIVYTAQLIDGQDIGGIDVGFLVRDNVTIDGLTQLGAAEFISTDPSDPLHDRPPLLLEATVSVGVDTREVNVMVVHNRSFSRIDDPTEGDRVRTKRLEQAESIAQKVQTIQTDEPNVPLIVIGDFNDYEFSDGYVDAIGHIKGDFNPADALLSGMDFVSPNLVNVVETVPTDDRYSFIFRQNAQVLDHALLSTEAMKIFVSMQYGRGNADAAEVQQDDPMAGFAVSDHDGLVVYLSVGRIFADGFETP